MDKSKPSPRVYGREHRLAEIRRVINKPDNLDDIAIDMAYTILCTGPSR